MKVLILSMTCGEGHNSIAQAIMTELSELAVECKIVDIYRSNKFKQKFNNWGYLLGTKYAPKTYEYFWRKEKNKNPDLRYSKTMFNKDIDSVTDDIQQEINRYSPSAIICSHCYASAIVSKLRHFDKIDRSIKLFSILTDYLPHPYWESSVDIDKVFIPYSHAINPLLKKGFSSQQLIETGLPINNKFYININKADIRLKLGINQNAFVVMLACGGYGFGKSYETIKSLTKNCIDVFIININGKNEKNKSRIDRFIKNHNISNVLNLGFADNVDELMSASDAIITRAGCVTVTEAITKQLPIVLMPKPRINEHENANILIKEGVALSSNKIDEIKNSIIMLKNNDILLSNMKNSCKTLTRANTTKTICRYIINNAE